MTLVDGLDAARAEDVIRAFTCYFQLVNLAEERERVRVLRDRNRSGKPVKDSIAALEVDPSALVDVRITPVLTAHPTEAKRRAVVEHLWRIAGLLARWDELPPGASDEMEVQRRMREEITGLWRTEPIRRHRPEPLDEVRAMLALFDETIFTTLPAALPRDGPAARSRRVRRSASRRSQPFLRWGTWVGGDRDGNPAVTAEVTRAAMAIQSDHALRGLEAVSRSIARTLSVSERNVPPSAGLRRVLARDSRLLPEVSNELARKLSDAPHGGSLGLAAHRLAATRNRTNGAYDGPDAFLRDIDVLQRSLDAGGASRLAWGELQHLRWQVETFGFHLASMEVRQHSSRAARRSRRARDADPSRRPSPATREVIAMFRAIADIQARLGPYACERVIVSFTRSADDLAGVLELARARGPRRSAGRRARPAAGDAERAGDRQRDPGGVGRDARCTATAPAAPRGAGGDGGLLGLGEGGGDARRQPGAVRRTALDGGLGTGAGACGSRSSTGEGARWAVAAGLRAERSRPNRLARWVAGSRSPNKARWRSHDTGTPRWHGDIWSR